MTNHFITCSLFWKHSLDLQDLWGHLLACLLKIDRSGLVAFYRSGRAALQLGVLGLYKAIITLVQSDKARFSLVTSYQPLFILLKHNMFFSIYALSDVICD